jgi:hypothetical protein
MVGGCVAQRPTAPPPLKLAVEAPAPKPEAPPPPTGAEILRAQPSQVRDAIKKHEQSGKWPIYRTTGYVLYPYDEGPQPELDRAPLRTTDIQPQEDNTDAAPRVSASDNRSHARDGEELSLRRNTPHIADLAAAGRRSVRIGRRCFPVSIPKQESEFGRTASSVIFTEVIECFDDPCETDQEEAFQ